MLEIFRILPSRSVDTTLPSLRPTNINSSSSDTVTDRTPDSNPEIICESFPSLFQNFMVPSSLPVLNVSDECMYVIEFITVIIQPIQLPVLYLD